MPYNVSGDSDISAQLRQFCAERETASPVIQSDSQISLWSSESPPPVGVYRTWVKQTASNNWQADLRWARQALEEYQLESIMLCNFTFAVGQVSMYAVISPSSVVSTSSLREASFVLFDALDGSALR